MMFDIAKLNLKMCEFSLSRLEAMGEKDSGLYNYYAYLSRKGTVLRPEEVAVARYVDRVVPKHKPVLELCAGAAQLGHLLSLIGYSTSAIEIDKLRYDLAVALGAYVGSSCVISRGEWQNLKLGDWQLLVTLNAATSHIFPSDTEWLKEYAMQGGEFIIRPRQFGAGIPVEIPGLEAVRVFEDIYHYRAAGQAPRPGRSSVADTCSRRGITRVVHCHADHFEPEPIAKRLGASADMALWLERCRPAIPTLFVKCPLGFHLDEAVDIGMALRLSSSAAIEADYLRTLVGLGAGVALHVHHEAWTQNTMAKEKLSPGQIVLHDYAQAHESMDHARVSAMVEGSLMWLREVTGLPLLTWHFVHGCWAFGASDPEICQLMDEVPLLYDLGCRADFSFPAGRRYCDPPWDQPKWVKPARGLRAFELPEADPQDEYAADRMLVWASHADDWWCGLDTYSVDSRKLTGLPDNVERYLELCPVRNGTAYIKTCGHGMNPYYWLDGPQATLGAFASDLAAKCVTAGVPVEFLTTDQVLATW